jgi:hypothetical protein
VAIVSLYYHARPENPKPGQVARGREEVQSRAADAAGHEQPVDASWNVGGYANNAAQSIRVHVTEAAAPA